MTEAPPEATTGPSRPSWIRVVLPVMTVTVVLAAWIVFVVVVDARDDGDEPTAEPSSGSEATPLSEVQTFEVPLRGHTDRPVDYEQDPPVGGRHHPVWLDCGVYDEPVVNENLVHDLEHGTVWITYDPDLSDEDVALLADRLPDNGILSPYPGQDQPVLATVWGVRLALNGADDPGLDDFIETYGNGETAPEPFASCDGGTRTPPALETDDAPI